MLKEWTQQIVTIRKATLFKPSYFYDKMVTFNRHYNWFMLYGVKFMSLLCFFRIIASAEYCTKDSCQDIIYDHTTHTVTLHHEKKIAVISLPSNLKTTPFEYIPSSDFITSIKWPRYGSMIVTKEVIGKISCHLVTWRSVSKDFEPQDCISLRDAYWYGGSELHFQRWPLENIELKMQPFVSEDIVVKKSSFGNVLEPLWIGSNGVAVYVDDTVPLYVSFNSSGSQQICFLAKFDDIYKPENSNAFPHLKYSVCKGSNILDVYQSLRTTVMDLPKNIPDLRMIRSPIWSTWAKYKANIDQGKVLSYADDIIRFGFPNSQLEIDDMFSTKYGDFDFDREKFPDPAEMTSKLRQKGFRTTVWIIPFANVDSKSFVEGLKFGYWLTDKSRTVPALVKWWQGIGAVIDPTNSNASSWYNRRLETMKVDYGIDSFKFDAGEITFLPIPLNSFKPLTNPNIYTTKYVETVSYHGDMIEVRCGYKSQRHPIFVRMGDKESRWGYDNGLKTIIPTALTFGILGYPFVLPDMIGGNGYGEVLSRDVVLPQRELYIRWLQLTAYLPTMQFSFAPWDYDAEVVQMAFDMVKIHETVVTPLLVTAAKDTVKYGYPIIRPMWWVDPDDKETYTIDSQFMIGSSLLVAPIVDFGGRHRDIYLPKGTWRDNLNRQNIDGGRWLKKYRIDLNQIATFQLL